MKNLYFVFITICFLLFSPAKAQLTLTKAANEPVAGDTYTNVAHDSVTVIPKTTGNGVLWDFSNATKRTTTTAEVPFSYTTAAAVAGSTNYPGCNLVEVGGSGNTYGYYKTTATQYELLGQTTTAGAFNFTNSAVLATWPIAYGYNATDAIAGAITAGTINANASGNMTVSATGTGSLVLPGGATLTNVLQLKVNQRLTAPVTIPGLPFAVTATLNLSTYQYYHASDKFAIVNVSYQSLALPIGSPSVTASLFINAKAVPIGIKETALDVSKVTVYPSPANTLLSIKLNSDRAALKGVKVFNQLGEMVLTHSGHEVSEVLNLNVESLKAGIYFLKMETSEGSVTTKFIKE
ncbi:MAG: T9SS type A sorting domain-containing protein [Sediminibacterium sp.]|nr:T9SS type A sorting domain-containing protein [Sediminibacterium sp.]